MTTLHFTGRARDAADHLIRHTPMLETIAREGSVTHTAEALTLSLEVGHLRLSAGERFLWLFLSSLACRESVTIGRLLLAVDEDCAQAVAEAVALAAGVRQVSL